METTPDNALCITDGDTAARGLDPAVVERLLANRGAFLGFLRKRLQSDEAAEDLLQNGLLKAVRAGGALADDESAVAWFYRILRNALTDHYRSRAVEERREESFRTDPVALGEGEHPAPDDDLHREVCACMDRLIPALKPEYGDLLRRIDLEGATPLRIAQDLGITVNNLQVRLHRSRQALKRSLELSCGACTRHGCLECSCGEGHSHE